MNYDKMLPNLLQFGVAHGFRPDVPIGMEEYISSLLEEYRGEPSGLNHWLNEQFSKAFLAMEERPNWLQDPEWPLSQGKPMIFVGQLDRRINNLRVSFYVFKGITTGTTKVVTQVLALA